MNCEWENECICMKCEFNSTMGCGCKECSKLGKEPYFAGDCQSFMEVDYEKSI